MRTGNLTPSASGLVNVGTDPIAYASGVFDNLRAKVAHFDDFPFTHLTDTPDTYAGMGASGVRVNNTETGLEFYPTTSGGGSSAGALTKVDSGIANTGDTVELLGWTGTPSIIVGINSLLSYNSAAPTQSQRWNIYYDNLSTFYIDPTCYGKCFDVHAMLTLDSGAGAPVVKNVSFGSTVHTETCTCKLCARMNFSYWCNNAAPSNYYYGTLCYALCYRRDGDVAWCSCEYLYEQPHDTEAQIKSISDTYAVIDFPDMDTWEVMACQVSLSYTDSGINASSYESCCYCCNEAACTFTTACVDGGAPPIPKQCIVTNTITFDAAPPGTIYCSIMCYTACGCSYAYSVNGTTSYAYTTHQGYEGYFCVRAQRTDCLPGTCTNNKCCNVVISGVSYISSIVFYSTACRSINGACACVNGNACCICQIVCSCVSCGDAACCAYNNMCSITDVYGCYCNLDPSGIVNWLAVAYK